MRRSVASIVLFLSGTACVMGQPVDGLPDLRHIDLANAQPLLRIAGPLPGDTLGGRIASGDIDGDGIDDLVLNEPFTTSVGRSGAGQVNVLYGGALRGDLELTDIDARTRIVGEQPGDLAGFGLAVGDYNADGFDDVAVGAPLIIRNGGTTPSGKVYIVWGRPDLRSFIDLADPPQRVTRILAEQGAEQIGLALATGDIDGDTIDDLLIGSPSWDLDQTTNEGKVTVLYGRMGFDLTGTVDLGVGPIAGRWSVLVGALSGSETGAALAAGDLDGDGIDDVCIGAPGFVPPGSMGPQGLAQVVYGDPARPEFLFLGGANLTGRVTNIFGDPSIGITARLGSALAAGHYTRDVRADLLIGAPGLGDIPGTAAIVRGDATRPAQTPLGTPGPAFGLFVGNSNGDRLGAAVMLLDVNGDGFDDAVLGAPGDNISGSPGRANAGAVYVRRSPGFTNVIPEVLSQTDNPNFTVLARFAGELANDQIGSSLGALDLTDDGLPDLVIGSPFATGGDNRGLVNGIMSVQSVPRLVRAFLAEQGNTNEVILPGDQIVLTFNRPVSVESRNVTDNHIYLSNSGATLGSDATIARSLTLSNVLIITLGETSENIIVTGDDPTTSTHIDIDLDNSIGIIDGLNGLPAADTGVAGVNDVGVDLRWRFVTAPVVVGQGGGVVGLKQNPGPTGAIDYEFTGHEMVIPTGSLSANAGWELVPIPGSARGQGIGPGLRVVTDTFDSVFDPPLQLQLTYSDFDYDVASGQIQALVRFGGVTEDDYLDGSPPLLTQVQREDGGPSSGIDAVGTSGEGGSGDNTGTGSIPNFFGTSSPGIIPRTYATLPVNPVEERTLPIVPSTGGEVHIEIPVTQGEFDELPLRPDVGSAYPLHRIHVPGHVVTTPTDPNRIDLTIRTTTLFERTYPAPQAGANLFPPQSGSLFTVQTVNAAGQPVSFTSPVNLQVHFIERTDLTLTDVVEFDGTPGARDQMRLVRSRVDFTRGPDFEVIENSAVVPLLFDVSNDPVEWGVEANNLTPLTGSNGLAVWGAVVGADLVSISLQEIVDHLLGIAPLTGPKLSAANTNLDAGGVDAADIVRFIENQPN